MGRIVQCRRRTFFKASGTYELPIGPGKKYLNNKGVTGQILGGWQVGWILDEEAGTANWPASKRRAVPERLQPAQPDQRGAKDRLLQQGR